MNRFRIGEQTYQAASLDDVSLRDIVAFNQQAAEFGVTWADLERAVGELGQASEAEAEQHPLRLHVIALTIWASRRAAGEQITFGDAIDFPLSALEFLPDTEDRAPKAKKAKPKPKPSQPDMASEVDDDLVQSFVD